MQSPHAVTGCTPCSHGLHTMQSPHAVTPCSHWLHPMQSRVAHHAVTPCSHPMQSPHAVTGCTPCSHGLHTMQTLVAPHAATGCTPCRHCHLTGNRTTLKPSPSHILVQLSIYILPFKLHLIAVYMYTPSYLVYKMQTI